MTNSIARMVKSNADTARNQARIFSGLISNEDLKEQTMQHFRSFAFGYIELDERIQDAARKVDAACEAVTRALRDIANLKAADPLREDLIEAIDELERIILRVGIVNGRAEALMDDVRKGDRVGD